jgi:hypothetical protein
MEDTQRISRERYIERDTARFNAERNAEVEARHWEPFTYQEAIADPRYRAINSALAGTGIEQQKEENLLSFLIFLAENCRIRAEHGGERQQRVIAKFLQSLQAPIEESKRLVAGHKERGRELLAKRNEILNLIRSEKYVPESH